MCTSSFTLRKLAKLYLQFAFYAIVIYGIFLIVGREPLSVFTASLKLFPISNIRDSFVSCFLLFYLFIPFLNKLLGQIDKREHTYLLVLLLIIYSIIPLGKNVEFAFNYVTWFSVIYILGAYLRRYGNDIKLSHKQWGWLALGSFILGCLSVLGLTYLHGRGAFNHFLPYHFVADSNKLFAVLISVTSFMWFKGIKMRYIPIINILGAATFGVLLIHANSDAMRQWLWKEVVDCSGHFGPSTVLTVSYATFSVLTIFIVCSAIEWFRASYIEPHIMRGAEMIYRRFKPTKQ